jgi:hypothetical protein
MNNTNTTSFLSKDNVEMIWELIVDEDFMQNPRRDERQMMDIQNFFITDIREFYEREKTRGRDLMSLNKMFIENVLQKLSSPQIPTPALNLREPTIEIKKPQAITAEDIQASRMNEFEKQFAERQNEFSRAMTLNVPEKPSFNDEMDKPIGEMEDLIARTLAQRNFDIEQIQQNVDKEKVKSFLASQDTSIKSEKGEKQKNMQQILKPAYNVGEKEVKYIQISQEELPQLNEVIDLQKTMGERRQVTWADEENIKLTIDGSEQQQEEKPSIFSKLKMKGREKTGEVSLSPFGNVLETDLKNPISETDLKMLYKKVDELSSKVDAIFDFIRNANKNKIDENSI